MRRETEIFQGRAEAGDQTYKDNKTRFEISVKFQICPQGSSLFDWLGNYSTSLIYLGLLPYALWRQFWPIVDVLGWDKSMDKFCPFHAQDRWATPRLKAPHGPLHLSRSCHERLKAEIQNKTSSQVVEACLKSYSSISNEGVNCL